MMLGSPSQPHNRTWALLLAEVALEHFEGHRVQQDLLQRNRTAHATALRAQTDNGRSAASKWKGPGKREESRIDSGNRSYLFAPDEKLGATQLLLNVAAASQNTTTIRPDTCEVQDSADLFSCRCALGAIGGSGLGPATSLHSDKH